MRVCFSNLWGRFQYGNFFVFRSKCILKWQNKKREKKSLSIILPWKLDMFQLVSFNIFCFLLWLFLQATMSLSVKNYKEVSRSFLNRVLLSNETTGVTNVDRQTIQSELKDNNFFNENSHVIWWRIHYDRFNRIIKIEPILDD